MKVAVARIGKSAFSTDPNDFIFHSDYNTFKIIIEATKEIILAASTTNQSFTTPHYQTFIPLPHAFAREEGYNQVFVPNSSNAYLWGAKLGVVSTGIRFNYVSADATNLTFNFDNTGAQKKVYVRFFLLEEI